MSAPPVAADGAPVVGAHRLALTVDVDWAPDPVLADTIALLDDAGVSCTLFVTHATPLLDGLDPLRWEIALHPNLNPSLAGKEDFRRPIDRLRASFPDARGIRSHGLVYGGPVADYLHACGFAWESNLFVPFALAPFREHNGMLRIPFGWSDGWTLWAGAPFTAPVIPGAPSGTGVHLFHPVHLFLNTETRARYDAARGDYHDAACLARHRNDTGVSGARDALGALLDMARDAAVETCTLSALAAVHA